MITFPWAVDDFFGGLKIASATFDLSESLQIEETGGGQIVTAGLGERLWEGSVQLVGGYHADLAALQARLSLIRESGRPFFVFPKHKPFPASDPAGTILGAAAPVIATLPSARTMTLSGLPAGYQLSPGDFLSFAYGSSPARQALHQIVTGGTANASGVAPAIEVTPAIRPGAATGAAVRLVRPFCTAIYRPGSYRAASYSLRVGSASSFSFVQTV